ncbi:MAG: hypothetical protein AABX28_00395 [Nanoarchaeota archaeon]
MKTDLIKIKKLENEKDMELLEEGDIVIISLGSGQINGFNEHNEYYGPAIFIGERLKGTGDEGFDFCRPHANTEDCFVGYHLYRKCITITDKGVLSSKVFFTYGTKYPHLASLI